MAFVDSIISWRESPERRGDSKRNLMATNFMVA
jgi:hypothetical protein